MSERTWDRIGSATGAIAVVLSLGGLLVGGAAGRAVRPNWDASTDLIVAFASRPVSGLSFMAGVVSTAFLLLAVFIVKLLLGLPRAEGGTGWLSASGIAGGIIYLAFDLIRFMLGTAHGLAVGHHLTSGEATALFDLTNAMTPYTWGAIAMLLIPTGVVVIRTGALPAGSVGLQSSSAWQILSGHGSRLVVPRLRRSLPSYSGSLSERAVGMAANGNEFKGGVRWCTRPTTCSRLGFAGRIRRTEGWAEGGL